MLTALSHGRITGFEGGAELEANIRVDVNGDPLDFCSAMLQDHTNWDPAVQAEIKSQIENETFKITFLSSGKTAIDCRWVFKRKDEAVPIIDLDLADDETHHQSRPTRRKMERERIKVRMRYKTCLIIKSFEQ